MAVHAEDDNINPPSIESLMNLVNNLTDNLTDEINTLETQIKELFTRQKKELKLISYITENKKNPDKKSTKETKKKNSKRKHTHKKDNDLIDKKNVPKKKNDKFNEEHCIDNEVESDDSDYYGMSSNSDNIDTDDSDSFTADCEEIENIFDIPLKTYIHYRSIEKNGPTIAGSGYLNKISATRNYIMLQGEDGVQKLDVNNKIFFTSPFDNKRGKCRRGK